MNFEHPNSEEISKQYEKKTEEICNRITDLCKELKIMWDDDKHHRIYPLIETLVDMYITPKRPGWGYAQEKINSLKHYVSELSPEDISAVMHIYSDCARIVNLPSFVRLPE